MAKPLRNASFLLALVALANLFGFAGGFFDGH
jgi:hypothetical protein